MTVATVNVEGRTQEARDGSGPLFVIDELDPDGRCLRGKRRARAPSDRLEQSADYLRGFAAAPLPEGDQPHAP